MRFTISDLMTLPLLVLAAVPAVTTASFVGLMLLPQFTDNGSEIRHWFLNHGFSVDFVTGHLTFFVGDIPTVLVLALLSLPLFSVQTRVCDQAAVVTLASLPFVEAVQVNSMSDVFCVDNLGWHYLATQLTTALALAVIIVAYGFARWKIPNPAPTRVRSAISAASLALILVPSIIVWQSAT